MIYFLVSFLIFKYFVYIKAIKEFIQNTIIHTYYICILTYLHLGVLPFPNDRNNLFIKGKKVYDGFNLFEYIGPRNKYTPCKVKTGKLKIFSSELNI